MRILVTVLAVAAWVLPAGAATTQTRRATMMGGGNGDQGKCTIEVDVDGVAEVSVSGDMGRLRTLSGQPALWRRFECTGILPRNVSNFRFRGIDGRGRVNLVNDPRNNGPAVVRIEDPQGGREGYTFDLEWSGGSTYGGNNGVYGNNGNYGNNGPYNDGNSGNNGRYGNNNRRYGIDDRDGDYNDRDREDRRRRDGNYGNGVGDVRAVAGPGALRACREAITQRISRDGYSRINILDAQAEDNPGRNDVIVGRATARGRDGMRDFDFRCSMNFDTGRVRSVDLNAR